MTRDGRTGLDILGYDECLQLLARTPIGRVAIHLSEHPPAIFPINYTFHDDRIVFRTDAQSMLHRAHRHTVAFEIDGIDRQFHLGWSVLVVGHLDQVTSSAEIARLTTLPLGPWAPGLKAQWMLIAPDAITGRSIPTGPA